VAYPTAHLAVSLIVGASRTLRWLLRALAVLLLAAAILCWRAAPLLAGLPLAGAALAVHAAARRPRACRIDVFGPGAAPLTVQQDQAAPRPARLLPGSVFWPALLVLRLSGAAPRVLLVLPDSVPPGAFRPLGVAVRTLAARASGRNFFSQPASNDGDRRDHGTRV